MRILTMKLNGRQRISAFTLVEIMVALGIFSLVLMAIYETWTALLRSSKTGMDAAAQVQRERIALRVLEEALTSARSFAVDLEHYSFVVENGSEATLSFVARLPQSFPRSGRFGDFDVRRVTFSVESGPNWDRRLVLRQNPILMDWDGDEKDHPLVLAKGVQEFLVECWDAQKGDWTDEWKQTNQIPKLVKFTLRLGNSNDRYSQPQEGVTRLVAPPAIMVPAIWQVPTPGPGPLPPTLPPTAPMIMPPR
jgi:type II secretion system protein J